MRKPLKFWLRRKEIAEPRACSSCGELLDLHEQEEFASAWITTADDTELMNLIAKEAWSEARAYQAPRGSDEIRSWRRVLGGDVRVGVVARVMPLELWGDDCYEERRWLRGGEAEALGAAMRLRVPPKELQYFPEPDPDTKPCAPEIEERLLADFDD